MSILKSIRNAIRQLNHCGAVKCGRLVVPMMLAILCLANVDAQQTVVESQRLERQIFVPFNDLHVLLEDNSNRVLLTREEYMALLESAKTREIKLAPQDLVVVDAEYIGIVEEGIARIQGRIVIEALNEGLVQIPLSIGGVALRSATLDGKPAQLYRGENAQVTLLVSGKERHVLELSMIVPVQSSSARQSISLQLPTSAATRFQLSVPGNVEVKSGAAVASRQFEHGRDVTDFELLASRDPMNIVMSLNNRTLKDDRVVVANSVLVHLLTPSSMELHATTSLNVIHGAIEQIKFKIPAGYQVSNVTSELLSHWELNSENEGEILTVQLRGPTRENLTLNFTAARDADRESTWQVPDFRVQDVAGQVSVIGILADSQLRLPSIEAKGVIAIDHGFLRQAIPASVLANSSNSLAIVSAYYAPQSDYSLVAKIEQPPAELTVQSSARLVVRDQQLELQTGFSLLSTYDWRFGVKLSLPEAWRFSDVIGADGNPVPFDRFDADQESRIHIRLPGRIESDQPTRIFVVAKSTPANWLDQWTEKDVEFPAIRVESATRHSGAIAIWTDTELRVRPGTIAGLEILDERDMQKYEFKAEDTPLAFLFKSEPYQLAMRLERVNPNVSARTMTFFGVQPNQLVVHGELDFNIRQAKTDLLYFQLSVSTPDSISIKGHNCQLKDFHSEVIGEFRRWTVQLSQAQTGKVKLLVDYQLPLDDAKLAMLVLAPISAVNVEFQTAMSTIEGSSELDIGVQSNGRSVDGGELSDALYVPGRYTLGAFSWPDANGQMTVRCSRRALYELPAAIVQRAEFVSSISADGKIQTAARFQLVTDQPFLKIQLPVDSEFWSIVLDGKPAKPQRFENSLLIGLTAESESAATNSLRDLQLVYESRGSSLAWISDVELQAPKLFLYRSSTDAGKEIPLIDLSWKLLLPEGYTVSQADSDYQSPQLDFRPSVLKQLGDWLYYLGGGIGGFGPFEAQFASERLRQISIAGHNYHDSSKKPQRSAEFGDSDAPSAAIGGQRADSGVDNGHDIEPVAPASESAEETKRISGESAAKEIAGQQGGRLNDPSPAKPIDSITGETVQSYLALRGLRSLQIDLTQSNNAFEFFSLGSSSQIRATVVHHSRLNWLAIAGALLIGAIGVGLTRCRNGIKLAFVLTVLLLGGLFPLAGPIFEALRPLAELSLLAAILVGVYFVVVAGLARLGKSLTLVATRALCVFLALSITLVASQNVAGQEAVTNIDQLRQLILQLDRGPDLKLPNDAIIIPFDPADPAGQANAAKVLLPYDYYAQLLQRAHKDNATQTTRSPVNYVLSSAKYSTKLNMDDDLTIQGQLLIDVLTDGPISVPLPFEGGALSEATVNGQPAQLLFAMPDGSDALSNKIAQKGSQQSSVVLLQLREKGQKVFEFKIKLRLERLGGWRTVSAKFPVGMTRSLDLTGLNEAAEVRLSSDADQRSIEIAPAELISTVLGPVGELNLQWKPTTAQAAIDQSLTAESEAILDVREDGLRLAWRVELDFRGSQRDSFSLLLPTGFLVERVTGDNVRGWELLGKESTPRLQVSLLNPATDREVFIVELSQRDFEIGAEPRKFDAPYLSVEGAALQNGIYTIRKSPILELKSLEQRAASRVDADHADCKIDVNALSASASPLGIDHFQCLRFLTTPFQIQLQASRFQQSVSGQTHTIFRFGQNKADFETQVQYKIGERPIHELSFDLPLGIQMTQVNAGRSETWTTELLEDRQRVHVYFVSGVTKELSLLVNGVLSEFTGQAEWALPAITLNDVVLQSGQIAIQVDPALSVACKNLRDCESVLVQQFDSWLNPNQRSVTRLALRCRGANYSASLRFTPISPRVTAESITNIRITPFAIEETILLDFDIQQAGIREVRFLLPKYLAQAKIGARLVREQLIQQAPAPNADWVQVCLILQDEVIGSYRVVIENDRQLVSGNQIIPVPIIETGENIQRFVTIQNSGRDELEINPSTDFDRLNSQLSQFTKLKSKLAGGEVAIAYMAKSAVANPSLTFATKQREIAETVAASIEFSKTTMVVDTAGAYRALQNFQVSNRSEQYLDIVLPNGAELLTVLVNGAAVKPVAWPNATDDRRLRIPLIKTPAGDLDYPVQLKYAGMLGDLSSFQTIDFPVIETLNIQVQLSQLHLRLPETYRWINFSGTMTPVNDQGDLEVGFLSYKARQIRQLAEQLKDESYRFGKFSKSRAISNLQQLEQEMDVYIAQNDSGKNAALSSQIELNRRAIAETQIQVLDQSESMNLELKSDDNRQQINQWYSDQQSKVARNSVTKIEKNFAQSDSQNGEQGQLIDATGELDSKWLRENDLQQLQAGKKEVAEDMPNESLQSELLKKLPAANPQFRNKVQGRRNSIDDGIAAVNPLNNPQLLAEEKSKNDFESVALGGAGSGGQGRGERAGGKDGSGDDSLRLGFGREGQDVDASVVDGKLQLGLSAAAIASLDIELPARGADFYFKSLRGNATVSGLAVSQTNFSNWIGAISMIGLCLVLLVVWRLSHHIAKSTWLRFSGLAILLFAGFLSVVTGTLPLFGLLALAFSLCTLILKLVRTATGTNSETPPITA